MRTISCPYCHYKLLFSDDWKKGDSILCSNCNSAHNLYETKHVFKQDFDQSANKETQHAIKQHYNKHVGTKGFNPKNNNNGVKVATILSLLLLVAVIIYGLTTNNNANNFNQEGKTEVQATILDTSKRTANNIIKPIKIPKYKILHTGTSFCDYDILINPINLNAISYKGDVEAILDDIASKYKKTEFTAWFYDNAQAAQLNYSDLELGKKLTKAETKLVDYHIVANYGNTGGSYYYISYFENISADNRAGYKAWEEAFNEGDFKNGYTPNIISNEYYNHYVDSIQKNQDAIIAAKEIVAQKAWDKSKAGRVQKKHPEWSKEDCINIANHRIWIGMDIRMVIYTRGNPDAVNPSNYGQGIHYQWYWEDYSPSCFYGGEDGIVTAYN